MVQACRIIYNGQFPFSGIETKTAYKLFEQSKVAWKIILIKEPSRKCSKLLPLFSIPALDSFCENLFLDDLCHCLRKFLRSCSVITRNTYRSKELIKKAFIYKLFDRRKRNYILKKLSPIDEVSDLRIGQISILTTLSVIWTMCMGKSM